MPPMAISPIFSDFAMTELILQIEQLLAACRDPEYRFLLLEPMIFYGIATGILMLGFGYFMKVKKLQIAALIVIGVTALTHMPYKDARISAQLRMDQVYKISYPDRMKGFKANTEEWISSSWKFRLVAFTAIVTILIGSNRNRIGYGFGIATAILGLFAAKNAMWLHYQDAVAYHPNLKKYEAPIDLRKHDTASQSKITHTPKRSSNRSPANANSHSHAPAGLAEPLSYNDEGQIPLPLSRPVSPLTR